jgi:hypothetical protein
MTKKAKGSYEIFGSESAIFTGIHFPLIASQVGQFADGWRVVRAMSWDITISND